MRAPNSNIGDFTSRLPSISAAGLSPPAADRLVRPELAEVYKQLAADIESFLTSWELLLLLAQALLFLL